MNHTFKSFLDNEKNTNEGNAFSAALKKAKDAGEKEFEVDGETYKVEEADENEEEPKAPKLMSFDDFVKDKSTIDSSDKSDDTSSQKVATDDEVNAKLPADKEETDLKDKEAKDDAKGEEEEEEEEADDLEDLEV
jgi:hypothetical protein